MVEDQPDYKSTVTILDDLDVWGAVKTMGLSELAVRLGGVQSFDRRGDLYYVDNFDRNVKNYDTFLSGASASVVRSVDFSWFGTSSLKLSTEQGVNKRLSVVYVTEMLPSKRIGMEVMFIDTIDTGNHNIALRISYYDGVNYQNPILRYYYNDKELAIIDENSVKHVIASNLGIGINAWYAMKLVVDFNTGKYVRVLFNGVEYDISEYGFYTAANSTTKHLTFYYDLVAMDGGITFIDYLDHMIFTQNEP